MSISKSTAPFLAMNRFFQTAADNVLLLIFLLPIVGAILVRLLAKSGQDAAYFTGIMNSWLTTSLAVVMVVHYDTSPDRQSPFQMTTSIGWTVNRTREVVATTNDETGRQRLVTKSRFEGPDIRLAVGVDRLSIWFVFLSVLGTLAAVYSMSWRGPALPSRLSWTLLTESACVGCFSALDGIFLCFCFGFLAWSVFMLIGASTSAGQEEVSNEAVSNASVSWHSEMLRIRFAKDIFCKFAICIVLFSTSLIGLGVTYWWMRMDASSSIPNLTFSMPHIAQGIPSAIDLATNAADYWPEMAPWLFILLVTSIGVVVGLPPFISHWRQLPRVCGPTLVAQLALSVLPLGVYLALRFFPTFPALRAELADFVLIWSALASLILAVGSFWLSTLIERLVNAQAICILIAFAGAFHFSGTDLIWLARSTVAMSGGVAVLLLLLPPRLLCGALVESRHLVCGTQQPRLHNWLAILVLAGVCHLPLGGIFWADWHLIPAFFETAPWSAWLCVLAYVAATMSVISGWSRIRSVSKTSGHLLSFQTIGLVPLVVFLVLLGVWPSLGIRS